jgi:hypothetical protein
MNSDVGQLTSPFPMPTLQKRKKKRSVIFTRENTDRVYFGMQMLPRVVHTFTKNIVCIIDKVKFFVIGKEYKPIGASALCILIVR